MSSFLSTQHQTSRQKILIMNSSLQVLHMQLFYKYKYTHLKSIHDRLTIYFDELYNI